MATQASTLRQSDSQPAFTTSAKPDADASGTHQQHSQKHPRMRQQHQSIPQPRWESAEFRDDDDDAKHSERLGIAENSVRWIQSRLSGISADKELDIEVLIELFADIKQAQKRGDIDYLRSHSQTLLSTLSSSISNFLRRFSAEIEADKFPVASLNADDIHLLFNGLSAIAGESSGSSLLSKSDFNKSRSPLQKVTESLLAHASEAKMFEKNWDSSRLINGLNWLSRGLKQGVFSAESPIIRQTYAESLRIMATWVASDGEHARPSTLVAQLDARQLGKCMVQLAAAMKFAVINIDEHRELLRDVVLGLLGGTVLNEFKLWKTVGNNHQQILCAADVEGAVITNISNTVKNCLDAEILNPDDRRVQTLVSQLCGYMQRITDKELSARNGQRLGNCCNFLRTVFEVEQRSGKTPMKDREAYQRICARLLGRIAVQAKDCITGDQAEQSLANLFSFVKAMDRTRSHSTVALNEAARSLNAALLQVVGKINSVDGTSAILSALQHFHLRHLDSAQSVYDLMIAMLGKLDPKDLTNWQPQARAMLMRTIVYCWSDSEALRGFPEVRDELLQLMRALFDFKWQKEDLLPYLKAALVLATTDQEWVLRNQQLLSAALPELQGGVVSVAELTKAIEHLQQSEPVIAPLPEPERRIEETTASGEKRTVVSNVAPAQERLPVGMTRLIQPVAVVTTTTMITSTATVNTTTTTKPFRPRQEVQSEDWQLPARVAKVSRNDIRILPSTEPDLVARGNSTADSRDMPDKRPSHPTKTSSSTKSNQNKPSTAATGNSKQVKLTPDQEWFQLLKKEGPLSAPQQKRLEELLKAKPVLAVSTEGKGSKARSALFYAISTGKPVATRVIMETGVKEDLDKILIQVLDEMVGDQVLEAFKVCLSQLSKSDLEKLRVAIEDEEKNRKSGFLKNIASGFLNVLQTFGLNFRRNEKQSDNSANSSAKFNGKKPSRKPESSPGSNRVFVVNDVAEIGRELVQAAHLGNVEKVITLLKTGSADKMALAVDMTGANALIHASGNGHAEVVKELKKLKSIEQQARSAITGTGANALMAAASNNHPEVVRELLTLASAELMVKKADYRGMNALMRAARGGAVEIVELLRKMDSGNEQALMVDSLGNNSLISAVNGGHYDVVEELLNMDSADDQAAVRNKDGMNALNFSAGLGRPDIVDLLINMKSSDQQALSRDKDSKNALMHAAEKGHVEIVAKLLMMDSAREQATARNNKDRSALECALVNGQFGVVRMLADFLKRD